MVCLQSRWVIGLALSVAVVACGKKKSSSSESESNTMSSSLAIGYPDGLSVPSFPKTSTTTTLMLDPTDSKGQTLEQKRGEQRKILDGEVEDCFQNLNTRLGFQIRREESCYEFDQEMIYGVKLDLQSKVYGTKDGLSRKVGSKEVCMVAFAREEMKEIELQLDSMLDRAQVMSCLAKKNGKGTPQNVNDEVDLTELMNEKRSTRADAPRYASAKLRRLADRDNRPVFQTEIKSTRGDIAEELTILHSPASGTDNNTYNGVITVKRSGDRSQDEGRVNALSIEYARAKDGENKKIRASVRRARFAATVADLFDANGRVNLQGIAQNADNKVVTAISFVEFDVNQSDNTGNLVYWNNPGGFDQESARGFVFKVEKDSDGKLKGCSISGAHLGLSIRKALREGSELKPNGFYHPFFKGPNCAPQAGGDVCQTPASSARSGFDYSRLAENNQPEAHWAKTAINTPEGEAFVRDETGSFVSRQCFKQTDAGEYEIDGSANLGAAGFELIKTDSPKFITPPKLKDVKDRPLR